MKLLEQFLLAQDGDFRRRVRQAMIDFAVDTSGDVSSGDYEVDRNRIGLGQDVVRRSDVMSALFCYAVVTRNYIDPACKDADIKRAVAEVWDVFAGVNRNAAKPPVPVASPPEPPPAPKPTPKPAPEPDDKPEYGPEPEEEEEEPKTPWYKRLFGG